MRIPHGLRAALAGQGGAAPATDSDFENVSLLLHGDGTNGAQNNTFTDSSANNFTITRNGNTTQGTFSPFSPTGWSAFFDGTANGFISTTPTTDFDLSGDFTLQAWIFPVAGSQSNASELICRGAPSTFNGWHWLYYNNKLNFNFNYAGFLGASTTTIPLNTWSHVAITRSGNTFTHYLNGVADGTFTSSATPTTNGSDVVYVGRASYDTNNRQFPGYMAQVSVIKGTALTTFNTTSPLSVSTTGQAMLACTANRFIDVNTFQLANVFTVGSGASIQAFSPFNPTAAYSASTHGGSGYFQDSVADYLTTPSSAQFNMGTGDWTVEGWFYTNKANQEINVTWHVGAINASDGMSGGVARDAVTFRSNGTVTITGAVSIGNQWAHVAWVKVGSSNTVTVYVNGVSVVSGTYSNSIATGTFTCGFNNTSFRYGGYISNLRVLKGTALYTSNFTPPTAPLTAITNTSLLLNFTNGGIIDNASKNVLETVGNAQISTSVKKFGTGSLAFDGAGDWAIIPYSQNQNFGTGNFTVEFWFRLASIRDYDALIGNLTSLSTTDEWLVQTNSSGQIRFLTLSGTSFYSASLSANTWYHFAAVRNGTTLTVYINGSSIGSYTSSDSLGSNSARPIYVGVQPPSAWPMNGYIDDLRITKGVARYTANFTPPTAAFPDL